MMLFNQFLSILLCLLIFSGLSAQQHRLSLYESTSITFNPASIGIFDGKIRASTSYAHYNPSADMFSQFSLDTRMIRGFKTSDKIGVGISFSRESLNSTKIDLASIGLAYHYSLNEQKSQNLSFGFQIGRSNKSISNSTFIDPNNNMLVNVDNIGQSSNLLIDDSLHDGFKYAFGLNFQSVLNEKSKIEIAYSINKFPSARTSVIANSTNVVTVDCTLNPNDPSCQSRALFSSEDPSTIQHINTIKFTRKINDRFSISPKILNQFNSHSFDVIASANLGFKPNPVKPVVIHSGIGYTSFVEGRFLFFAGIQLDNLDLRTAVNFGSFNRDLGHGYEFSLLYTFGKEDQ